MICNCSKNPDPDNYNDPWDYYTKNFFLDFPLVPHCQKCAMHYWKPTAGITPKGKEIMTVINDLLHDTET